MTKFVLLGAAGYIAPRHLQAIKEVGGDLVAAFDPCDSVGILDRYFSHTKYFSDWNEFKAFTASSRKNQPDYTSICSPNYLHFEQVCDALNSGSHAICEKPLVLDPVQVDILSDLEKKCDRRVFSILQLRVHPELVQLKKELEKTPGQKHKVRLTYVTSRGDWFLKSWKGNIEKSGGLATSIGIHFFDLLVWLFGKPTQNVLEFSNPQSCSGLLELENAEVEWFLSIDQQDLKAIGIYDENKPQQTYRSIQIDGKSVEFSSGFTDLHSVLYTNFLKGISPTLKDMQHAIQIVHELRHRQPIMEKQENHPLLRSARANCEQLLHS